MPRTNLKKAAKRQKKGYDEISGPTTFQWGDWVGHVNPPVSDGKLRYRNRGPWLVLVKTRPFTYEIQCRAGANPEIVHVDRLDRSARPVTGVGRPYHHESPLSGCILP